MAQIDVIFLYYVSKDRDLTKKKKNQNTPPQTPHISRKKERFFGLNFSFQLYVKEQEISHRGSPAMTEEATSDRLEPI